MIRSHEPDGADMSKSTCHPIPRSKPGRQLATDWDLDSTMAPPSHGRQPSPTNRELDSTTRPLHSRRSPMERRSSRRSLHPLPNLREHHHRTPQLRELRSAHNEESRFASGWIDGRMGFSTGRIRKYHAEEYVACFMVATPGSAPAETCAVLDTTSSSVESQHLHNGLD